MLKSSLLYDSVPACLWSQSQEVGTLSLRGIPMGWGSVVLSFLSPGQVQRRPSQYERDPDRSGPGAFGCRLHCGPARLYHRLLPLSQSLRSRSGSHPDTPPGEQEADAAPDHSGHGRHTVQDPPPVSAGLRPTRSATVSPGAESGFLSKLGCFSGFPEPTISMVLRLYSKG